MATPSKAKKPRTKAPKDQLTTETAGPSVVPTKRYSEMPSVAVRSGVELGQDASMDDLQNAELDGELDADMAEMSLGQRLTALTGQEEAPLGASSSDDERKDGLSATKNASTAGAVPASSLTRTLIQALHSSDANLLETCLTHSNATLIQNTVRRLPSQLAIPLVTACVERLGRGRGVGRGKGGGAAASAQRGTGLVRWVRAVLVIHGGHLLTMPDLVARLSGLHATLSTRLALQDSLLALSGRLDMVISQIEMRSSTTPAPLPLPSKKSAKGKKRKGPKKPQTLRYVEGESTDEEEGDMEVEVESGDDAGSVEDIELGGSDVEEESMDGGEDDEDEDEDDEDEDDYEDDDDEDSEPGSTKVNGFIDDEAEEFTGDEDEDESE